MKFFKASPERVEQDGDADQLAKEQEIDEPPMEEGSAETRGNWTRQLDFMLSCVGYAVGLGNLWRFPYLCMRNGGGAFLIPYFGFLFLCGVPLFFMELSLGQFSCLSPLEVWKISPLFRGLGWGMVLVSGILSIYYNLIISWVLYYLYSSFSNPLPWASCGNEWNTPYCLVRTHNSSNSSLVTNSSGLNITHKTPSQEFFERKVLNMTDGIGNLGGFNTHLLICLIIAWVIIFLCLFKGVKSSGKVVYVTAICPYIFLFILLIRGTLLDGAWDGIRFYITPQWHKLKSMKVWGEACLQIFYSLGPAWGGLITMSSYNKFKNNMYHDALIVPVINCGTSFFAGFVIFSIIGFMAKEANLPVDKVITEGPGLAFVAYPEALTRLPFSPAWAVMFFVMLLTLGLDSQFGQVETLASGFADSFPHTLGKRKTFFTAFICLIEFLFGLPLVTRGGMYIFQILDWYCAAFSVMVIALLECIVIAWIYKARRLYDEIEMMIGYKPSIWWKICWLCITPSLMIWILIFTAIHYAPPKYGKYIFPKWAISLGWSIAMVSIIPIPIVAIYKFLITPGTPLQRIKKLIRPEKDWGPGPTIYKKTYKYRNGINAANANIELSLTQKLDTRNEKYIDTCNEQC
ncbi:DgyrCDS1001 [Dimorphilus gyrociliatus]|uniref:Transporter n=1 Tax=Dimorphilus gyrociliatus TaxID=2664684 RepID=A0A7I8V7F6_9ANNE|nr:DgyrCDS1001 [Dimorphilus gyrociliatus]